MKISKICLLSVAVLSVSVLVLGGITVITLVHAKLEQNFDAHTPLNVKDFGAAGDGFTDDSDAIQRAINTQSAIFIPEGNYLINKPIELVSNSTIRGAGTATTIIMNRVMNSAFLGTSKTNIHISDLNIRGFKADVDRDDLGRLFLFKNSSNLSIRNCELSSAIVAVRMESCENTFVCDNYFHDIFSHTDLSRGYGILLENGNNFTFNRNQFKNIQRHSIYVSSGASHGQVSNNFISNNGSVAIAFNDYSDLGQQPTTDIIVSSNVILNVGYIEKSVQPSGICISGQCLDFLVLGNFINRCTQNGITIQGDAHNEKDHPERINIAANNILNTGVAGILSLDATDVLIHNNYIENGQSGIVVAGSSSGEFAFSYRNSVNGNTINKMAKYGITANSNQNKLVDFTLGNNNLSNINNKYYNIPINNKIKYHLPYQTFTFWCSSLKSKQTVNANTCARGYAYYILLQPSYAVRLSAYSVGEIQSGNIVVRLKIGGKNIEHLSLVLNSNIVAGETCIPIGLVQCSQYDKLEVLITTDNDYSSSKSNVFVQVDIIE